MTQTEIMYWYAVATLSAPLTHIGREFPELQEWYGRQLFVEYIKEKSKEGDL